MRLFPGGRRRTIQCFLPSRPYEEVEDLSGKPERALRSASDGRSTSGSRTSSQFATGSGTAARRKIFLLADAGDETSANDDLASQLSERFDVLYTDGFAQLTDQLRDESVAGVFLPVAQTGYLQRWAESQLQAQILSGMCDGVVLVDECNTILWANDRLQKWAETDELVGMNFYAALGSPEILGPDFCPFHTALATNKASNSTLKLEDNLHLQVHAAPLLQQGHSGNQLIVTIRDITNEMLHQQKLSAIHKAGIELADLTPQEVFDMPVEDRIELLKSNILHYTKDLLNFDVFEIRMLDEKTRKLEPLLSFGLEPTAAQRLLCAESRDNGVTGFVAATGKSYLCENTTEDPLYLRGFKGAKSSLTVPLILHDQVIGTFNVESPESYVFSESDLQFLELFTRDVAVALNTLELLIAQKANAAQESVAAIHSAVAMPVDEILNNAVNVMERYIGHEPDLKARLQSILQNAREVKQNIQSVGQQMTPAEAVPTSVQPPEHPLLRGRRFLVVDADESVRRAAHGLLDKYNCVVETAHTGGEAIFMIQNTTADNVYDVIIADVRLDDMPGHDFLCALKKIMEFVPLILMSGFGYDPDHSIVKARQLGLNTNAVLFKPFRLDQLLGTVEMMLSV